jgi:hypothetical protein
MSLGAGAVELTDILFKETAKNIPARTFFEGLEIRSKKGVSA